MTRKVVRWDRGAARVCPVVVALRRRVAWALIATACLAAVGCQTVTRPAHHGSANDVAAIEQVVEAFRTSLIAKDKPRYMSLFFSDRPHDIGWQHVSEDARLEHIRRTKPDAIKARRLPDNHFVALIDEAVATRESREETVANLRIDTDGEIASASFDYAFLADGKKTNWGKELWLLVRTEQGWKIFSVVYTVRDEFSSAR